VSAAYGVPAWRDLVLELLFYQVAESRKMGGLPPQYRRALSRWMKVGPMLRALRCNR